KFAVISDEAVFDDGNWHQITITYDDDENYLALFIDGQETARTEASGIILGSSRDAILGNTWSDPTVDAYIENISLKDAPESVDEAAVLDQLTALNLLTVDEILF
ncbi:LamG-like jellyroll fold domain-containing protein, partial [Planktotalea sp.]